MKKLLSETGDSFRSRRGLSGRRGMRLTRSGRETSSESSSGERDGVDPVKVELGIRS